LYATVHLLVQDMLEASGSSAMEGVDFNSQMMRWKDVVSGLGRSDATTGRQKASGRGKDMAGGSKARERLAEQRRRRVKRAAANKGFSAQGGSGEDNSNTGS
jgi:hypothetical protein